MRNLSRREMLRLVAGASATGAGWLALPSNGRWGPAAARAATSPTGVSFDPAPFTLGVASGDPTLESVILWTRLAPQPTHGDGGITADTTVNWVVATDPALSNIVASGSVLATAARAHSVHADVAGLEPGSTYYYAFSALGVTSRSGRTRTARRATSTFADRAAAHVPGHAGSAAGDRVRFGVVSCQHFGGGYYAAYRHLAAEDLDLVVHLGDYIYEGDVNPGAARSTGAGGSAITTLEDYRVQHATYKGDPDLRAAHAAHPWVVTWDDHEVRNNYAGADEPASFRPRQAAGYQAYYEHLPIRTPDGPPQGSDFQIYRQAAFAGLVDLLVLDTRQYRDDQPASQGFGLILNGNGRYPADRTLLGAEQKAWLKDRLASSGAAWKVVANQVMLAPFRIGGAPNAVDEALIAENDLRNELTGTDGSGVGDAAYFNPDTWSGYQAERNELLHHIHENEISDVVVLTGDWHRNFVNDVKVDFDDPTSPIIATEFLGTSITSGSGNTTDDSRLIAYPNNNHIRFIETEAHGYLLCDVTGDRWRTDIKVLTTGVGNPDAGLTTLASWEIQRGNPVVQQVFGDGANPVPRTTIG